MTRRPPRSPLFPYTTPSRSYEDVTPSLSISKSVAPGSVQEGGVGSQSVTYSYTVSNTSAATTDHPTVSPLLDDNVGDLLAAFKAANGGSAVLAPGASVPYTATQTVAVGKATDRYSNTVTVTADFFF